MMHDEKNNIQRAVVFCLLSFASFSVSDGLRKFLAHESYSILDILFWQGIFGLILLTLASPLLGGFSSLWTSHNRKWHILRGLLMAVNTFMSISVLSQVPMMDAYTIFFLSPFVTSLLGAFAFKERIGPYRLGAIMLGFLGALVAFRPGFAELNPAYGLALISVVTFSVSSILARHMGKAQSFISFGYWTLAILVTVIFCYKGGDIPYHNFRFLALCFVIGLAYSSAAIGIAYGFSLAPTSVVASYQYTQIIFAMLMGYFVFHDVPDFYKLLGSGVIVGSGVFFFARERRAIKRNAKKEAEFL